VHVGTLGVSLWLWLWFGISLSMSVRVHLCLYVRVSVGIPISVPEGGGVRLCHPLCPQALEVPKVDR
jgi:hypothetical protein